MDILIENETITQGPSAEGTILPCTGGCAGMEMLDELAEWDLVCISDSTGWEIAERYAENIRRDTGKSVRVRDYATGNLSAIRVLNALRTEAGNLTDERFRSLRADLPTPRSSFYLPTLAEIHHGEGLTPESRGA